MIKKALRGTWRAFKFTLKHTIFISIKVVFFTMLLFMVLGAAGWFFFVKYVNADVLSVVLADKIQQTFNRPVIMGAVDLKLFNSVQISYLEIMGGEVHPEQSFLRTGKITIRYNPVALLKQEILVEEITVEDPRLFIILDAQGRSNVPKINTSSSATAAAPAAKAAPNVVNIAGTPFTITVKDWAIKRGLVTYANKMQGVSHTIYEVDTKFDNLKFNELSAFSTSFVLRNAYKNNIFETFFTASGRVNLADFVWDKFAVRSLNMDVMFFKEPIKITADADNLKTPFISFTAKLPQIKDEDLSLFIDKPLGVTFPPSTIKASASLKKNYRALTLDKLNISALDINLNIKGSANMESGFLADITVKADPFTLDAKHKNYPPLSAYNLKGKAGFDTKLSYKENKLTVGDINISLDGAWAKAGNFYIENVTAGGVIKNWYSDMSAEVKTGGLKLGATHFTDVTGTVSYRKNALLANVKSAKVNGTPIKLTTDILNFNSDRRRQINSKFYFQTLDPMGVVDIVYDFVYAITNKKTFKPKHTGDMAWLRNFRDGLPKFMPNFKGVITADKFTSAVASGTNFEAEFDLKGLVEGMKSLNGRVDAKMESGTIYNLEKKAAEEKVLGVAFQPFIVMHRMEKAGSFKVGTVLRDVPYSIAAVSVDFENSNMNIVNSYLDGPTLGVSAKGWVDWYNERMDLTLWTIFRNTSRSGALAENLTDVSGAPALSFRVHKGFENPSVSMLSARKTNEEILKAKARGLRTAFSEGEKYRAQK